MAPSLGNLSLVQFEAADGLRLSGLLFEPTRRRKKQAAIYLHGNGDSSVFTSARRTNAIAGALTERGIAFLPFDNRGAHRIKWMKRRIGREREPVDGGMAFELIRDCVHDIDGALRYLHRRGYRRFHLIGHSTGANKICLYHYVKPRNRVSANILLGPGDDTGIYYDDLGHERFFRSIERARREIDRGRGGALVPKSWSPFLISYRSFLDTVDPDGDYNVFPFHEVLFGPRISRKPLFREYRSITKPTLVVYGAADEYAWGDVESCMDLLRIHTSRPRRFAFRTIEDADHGFGGHEQILGETIADWLSSRRP